MSLRSDSHAAATAVLSLPEEDRQIVIREAKGGCEASCDASLDAQLGNERLGHKLADRLPVPALLRGAEGEDSFRVAAWSARGRQGSARRLDACMPDLIAHVAPRALVAPALIVASETERERLVNELADLERRRDTFRKENASILAVASRLGFLGVLYVFLLVAEFVGNAGTLAANFGFGAGMPWSRLWSPAGVPFLGTLCLLTVVGAVVPPIAYLLIKRLDLRERWLWLGFALLLLAGAGLTLTTAALRFSGSVPVAEMTGSVVLLGGSAISLIGLVGTPILLAFATLVSAGMANLGQALRAVSAEEAGFRRQIAATKEKICSCDAQIVECRRQEQIPGVLRAAFEAAVLSAAHVEEEFATVRRARRAQALGAFRHLATLDAPEREAVIQYLMRHVDVPSERAPKSMLHVLKGAGVLLLAFAGTGGLPGCTMPEFPVEPAVHSLVIACDPTGERREDVCTQDLIERLTTDWMGRAAMAPGATVRLVRSAGSYETTNSAVVVRVPPGWGEGDLRFGIQRWTSDSYDALHAAVPVLIGQVVPEENRSDLIALVTLSARDAREDEEHGADLILASDGRFISLGMNAEDRVPTAAQVIERIRAAGIPWDLSFFSRITLCGMHNAEFTAADHAALDKTWRGLIEAGNGPKPTIFSSCQDLGGGEELARQRKRAELEAKRDAATTEEDRTRLTKILIMLDAGGS